MAKRTLAGRAAIFGTYAGIGTAAVVMVLEFLTAFINILQHRFHLDGDWLVGHLGIVGRFFDRLQSLFASLAGGGTAVQPCLLFAGLSGLVAYVWYERSKMRRKPRASFFQPLLVGVAALTAAPVLVSALSVAVF